MCLLESQARLFFNNEVANIEGFSHKWTQSLFYNYGLQQPTARYLWTIALTKVKLNITEY